MANHSIAKSALATFFTLATSSYAFANSAIGSLSDRPERAKRTGSAALISDQGHILSSSALVGRADSMFFAFKGGGVPVEATVVAVDDAIGVALLKLETIPANGVSPIIFSKNGATVGRLVTAQELINGALSQTEGAVSNALVRENGASRFLKHNALISAAGYGGILENECGEGVGINVVDPFLSTRRARQLPEPEGGIYAADLDGVLGFVRTRSVEIAVANDICLSAEERNKKLEEQREEDRSNFRKKESEKQAEIDRVEQELVEKERKSQQAQERADEAQREAERRAAEVERLKRDRKASAKERQAAEEDLEAARKDAEQAAIDAAERAEEIKTLESEQAALQEAMDASDKRQKIILIGAGVGFVLLSLLPISARPLETEPSTFRIWARQMAPL